MTAYEDDNLRVRMEWIFRNWLGLASDDEVLILLRLVRQELGRRGKSDRLVAEERGGG